MGFGEEVASAPRLVFGRAFSDKRKRKAERLLHRLFDRMAFMLGQVKHHVHIVPDIAGRQTIQGNAGSDGA